MKHVLWLFCILGMLSSCEPDRYPGYSPFGPDGVYFKVISFQEGASSPAQGDVVRFRMSRVEDNKVVWHDSKVQVMQTDTMAAGLRSSLSRIHVGDSISFLIESEAYAREFGERPDPVNRISEMHMSIIGVIDEKDWLQAVELDKAAKSERESKIIDKYLANRADSDEFNFEHGIWQRVISFGDSLPFSRDEELLVMYRATLLDGTVIDDRSKLEDALSYSIGMQGQLIPGLVTAIKHMERGEKLELILPSAMAFGDDGSVGGIVLPWTPVRYVLNVDLRIVEPA